MQRRRVKSFDGSVGRVFDWQPNCPEIESSQLKFHFSSDFFDQYFEFAIGQQIFQIMAFTNFEKVSSFFNNVENFRIF